MEAVTTFLTGLVANYGHFFSWQDIHRVMTDPVSWGIVFWLVILEGLLSCDNALVLAVVVNKLPKHQQKKALLYGIWGAYFFRFIAIGLGTYLVKIKWVQILGAGYLLWMAGKFFLSKGEEADEGDGEAKVSGFWLKMVGPFWATVITVELMDITFSVDSILAAFAMSNEVWVLFMGGILGILMMRGVATIFIKLLEKYPELEASAYVLIALIGGKLMGQAFGYHIPHGIFFSIMAAVLLGTIVLHHLREGGNKAA
ncbi:Integral membrane protein TerC [Desulforamulus reducens MI-1]|uniref:Integral membrane protein TerC n=1 Tax=Desulforamulus reducens (strain ATCC BAA-1160 / DSM 100696 / MI-1) TaxID=349161 RepID=A4J1D4_DESRM|nr:TerC family protein [Desulforamulus reducens]ABO48887.1 Integral membrane protein TerC [Desulforamulus reducens MI-1]